MEATDLRPPPLIEEAVRTARVLQVGGNARWEQTLGALGAFGGFQVTFQGVVTLEGQPVPLFRSVLFGGRSYIGPARDVVVAQRAFIASRTRKGRK